MFRCIRSLVAFSFFLTSTPMLFGDEAPQGMAEEIVACQTNAAAWPGLHWSIAHSENLLVTDFFLDTYPEQLNERTPSTPIWDWHDGGSGDKDYDYIRGYDPGQSAVELALYRGDIFLMKRLIEAGANPSLVRRATTIWIPWDWVEVTPLSIAIDLQNGPMIEELLKGGASIESIYQQTQFRERPKGIYSAFMYALLQSCDDSILIGIIEKGMRDFHCKAEPVTDHVLELFKRYTTSVDGNGSPWPPLHHAVYVGDLEAAQELLRYGANPFQDYEFGALYNLAMNREESDFVRWLLENQLFVPEILLRSVQTENQEFLDIASELGLTEMGSGLAFGHLTPDLGPSTERRHWEAVSNGQMPECQA